MRGINKVILVGSLGKAPESRGSAVKFTVATSEKWKGEEKTEWHNVVAFGKLAEICAAHLDKGSQVYIEGKLSTSKWEDKDGITRYTTEILANEMQMLGGKRQSSKEGKQRPEQNNTPDFDDDLPF